MTTYYVLKVANDIKIVIPWNDKEGKPTVEDFVQHMRRQHYELQYVNQPGYETKEGGKSGPEIAIPVEIDEVELMPPLQTHPSFV